MQFLKQCIVQCRAMYPHATHRHPIVLSCSVRWCNALQRNCCEVVFPKTDTSKTQPTPLITEDEIKDKLKLVPTHTK